MAPLFSKVDLNKLWHDVQNEETLICAKFGKDLFNISKVVGRKIVAQFFDSQCRIVGLPGGEEIMTLVLRFDTIPARDGQTDRRTDTLLSQRPALA